MYITIISRMNFTDYFRTIKIGDKKCNGKKLYMKRLLKLKKILKFLKIRQRKKYINSYFDYDEKICVFFDLNYTYLSSQIE